MATLVTGGTGFVASNIVRELAWAGHQVVCLDLNAADEMVKDFVQEVSSNITFVQGNILDKETLARLSDEHSINKIVHAAVYTANRRDLETQRSREVVDINVEGTANLLDLAKTLDVDRFVYVSSGSAYGMASLSDRTLNEDTPVTPHTLYAITKYASELLTQRYGELHGFSTASVRLSTPYGPMERITGHRAVMSVFHDWTGQALRGEDIHAENMDLGRDYTYVSDIADGIRTVLDAPSLPHHLYNLTSGVWLTYRTILAQIQASIPGTKVVESAATEGQPEVLDIFRGPLSGHRLYQDLKWTPKYDLRAGLEDYFRWRRESGYSG